MVGHGVACKNGSLLAWYLFRQPEPCHFRYDHDGLKYNQDKHRQMPKSRALDCSVQPGFVRQDTVNWINGTDKEHLGKAPEILADCFILGFAARQVLLRSTAFDFTTKGILQARGGRRLDVRGCEWSRKRFATRSTGGSRTQTASLQAGGDKPIV